jgi:hypothetical protein
MKLYKTMSGIGVLAACLLGLSYPFRSSHHGAGWILGGVGWFGFWLCVLSLIVLALLALGRSIRRRTTAA